MYIIDIPDGTHAGPSPSFAAAAEAIAAAKRKPPLVQVSVNGDEAIIEAVELLRSARTQMELLTNTINERFNVTFIGVGDKITNIVGNIDTITNNVAHSSSNLNQPVLFMLFMCVLLLIFIVVLLLFVLKTRREFKKRKVNRSTSTSPINGGKRKNSGNRSGMVEQLRRHLPGSWRPLRTSDGHRHRHRSDSRDSAIVERGGHDSEKKKPTTSATFAPTAPPMSSSAEYSNAPTLKKTTSTDTPV